MVATNKKKKKTALRDWGSVKDSQKSSLTFVWDQRAGAWVFSLTRCPNGASCPHLPVASPAWDGNSSWKKRKERKKEKKKSKRSSQCTHSTQWFTTYSSWKKRKKERKAAWVIVCLCLPVASGSTYIQLLSCCCWFFGFVEEESDDGCFLLAAMLPVVTAVRTLADGGAAAEDLIMVEGATPIALTCMAAGALCTTALQMEW